MEKRFRTFRKCKKKFRQAETEVTMKHVTDLGYL
jgi:hypothetical protein